MSQKRYRGCNEYEELSRRGFLGLTAKAAALASMAPSWVPLTKFVDKDGRDRFFGQTRDIIVSVYLRGGCDSLSTCVPFGDPNYYTARPNLAIPRPDSSSPNKAINLNGFFGLPPAMQPLKSLYDAGDLLVVHATGSNDDTRSHFDAQHFMEAGDYDKRLWTGWLGRHLATIGPVNANALLRGVALTYGMPLTLEGAPRALPLSNLTDYNFGGMDETLAARRQWLGETYGAADAALKVAAENTLRTYDLLKDLNIDGYVPAGGATYGDDDFAWSMKAAAAFIRHDVGVEALHVDFGGWDTHEYEGPIDGQMANNMSLLANGLRAFYTDIQGAGYINRVIVVVMSEFGRVVAENGSYGTDHGHGGAMWLLGGAVRGGRVYTNGWPGLAPGQLWEGQDLAITTDYRDVLAEIVQKRLGNTQLSQIFPGYAPTFRNLVDA
ncbi:MAG: DUF1501 domain-containing protein [Fimbriimonadaceae bacterium]|nr:DUF1501 domain-containing protein [Fimbriimonadaceae bacterium]